MNDKTQILAVLKDAAKKCEELEVEANFLLLNHDEMKKVLIERANIIINLPAEIRKVSSDKSLLIEIGDLANLAILARNMAKNSKGLFGLMVMLTPHEAKTGDPNFLEEIIQKLEKE